VAVESFGRSYAKMHNLATGNIYTMKIDARTYSKEDICKNA
jgi:hypothetical protein